MAAGAQGQRDGARVHVRRARGKDRHPGPSRAPGRARHRLPRPQHPPEHARGDLRGPRERAGEGGGVSFNRHGVWAIYRFEMARAFRTPLQSFLTPVITTSLYFVVFGAAIGGRMSEVGGVPYGAFIVPGLVMLSIFTESIANASFGIYFPKFTGTIYELLSAPVSPLEIVLAYVGAATSKSVLLGLIILATAGFFVPIHILHPLWMAGFLVLTAATFCLFGFVIGIVSQGFEQLNFVPTL